MKITILALHLGYGGIEKFISNIANMLIEDNEIEIISIYKLYDIPPFYINPKVKITYLIENLKPNREELYDRINKRVDEMFKEGLLKEAKKLYKKNYKNFSNIIGYRELERYFKKEISLNEAKELIKQNTRKYAKRQFTWFNNQMKDITWFDVDYNNFDNTINAIKKFLV